MRKLDFLARWHFALPFLSVISILALWLALGAAGPDESGLIKVTVFLLLLFAVFVTALYLGLLARFLFRWKEGVEKRGNVAIRQATQTAVFAGLLIWLQSKQLLNGWVIMEFIVLVLIWDWYWVSKLKDAK